MKLVKLGVLLAVLATIFTLAISLGSVNIPPGDIFRVILYRTIGIGDMDNVRAAHQSIVWELRLPRVLLAFIVGAALAVSGAVMQSVLRNPLASSFTLGVSSGASFGAALVIFTGIAAAFTSAVTIINAPGAMGSFFATIADLPLPIAGFTFGMLTIVLVVVMSTKMDGRMENSTIILVGMVISLFINALTTLLMAIEQQYASRLIFWQLGSFSMRGWAALWILAPIVIAGVLLVLKYHRELDIMTFGEQDSQLLGVDIKKIKWILLIIAAAITGSAISFVGIIGFVDLVAPHVVRRIFGARHAYIIPLSAVFGGAFMILCDLIARLVVSPGELPVGVVSALIGAPFFAYVFFVSRRDKTY